MGNFVSTVNERGHDSVRQRPISPLKPVVSSTRGDLPLWIERIPRAIPDKRRSQEEEEKLKIRLINQYFKDLERPSSI